MSSYIFKPEDIDPILDGYLKQYTDLTYQEFYDLNKMSFELVQVILLAAIKDFLDKKIEAIDISWISDQMLGRWPKRPYENKPANEYYSLEKALIFAGELEWYLDESPENYPGFFEVVEEYYQQNKQHLVPIKKKNSP